MIEREWMYNRLDEDGYLRNEFVAGVDTFIKYACDQENFKQYPFLKCPCSNCWNKPYMEVDSVKLHLYKNGYRENYSCWSCHGETYTEAQSSSAIRSHLNPYRDMVMDSYVPISEVSNDEGLEDGEEPPNQQARRFFDMLKNAEKPLYDGCKKTLLSMASRMINLKCEFNIPHRAIDGFASFVKDICPNDNLMTGSFYATRKLVQGLELPHLKIDVCRKGCVLFWNENAHLEKCGSCDAERFKKKANGKLVPEKFMIYFPITARLQRLYAAKSTASYMSWHSEYPRNNETMSHPRDGEAWKHFDATYPGFAAEPRNVRLGLCTDGFNPFGKFGKSYSCWPVILTPYNLPPSLCMKRQTLFLSMIIPGPKNPKGKLDVYLQPLVEELKHLWNVGAITYDASKKRNFNMKAALLWTISDFPAYGMLSGWSTAGKLACPYCMEKSKSFYLKHSHKQTWFDCHRPFLHPDHVFRNNKSSFVKNKVDHSTPPPRLDGEDIWKRVSNLPKATEYNRSCEKSAEHNWTKQSILWELPYWSKLLIRHNLDVMHIEKNFFDQLIHTIMDVKGKTKDTKQTRKDLAIHCKRRKLHVHDNSKKTMPHAPFVLCKEKRKVLCKWVLDLKFPDGYASNLSRCVNLGEGKLFGMKSHDCHVFMERLLPVAFKELVPLQVWKAITEISQFFRDICSSCLNIKDVVRLQENIAEIICKLERIFPPAFFNVMEHLPIHLPFEAKVGGPVHYRWMYPFERFLNHLKRKVGNKAKVEGSICNAYLTEEISNFCTFYFESDVDTKARDIVRNAPRNIPVGDPDIPPLFSVNMGHASTSGEIKYLDDKDYQVAHGYVLANCELLKDYERVFETELKRLHPRVRPNWIWNKFADQFPKWLKQYVTNSEHIKTDLIKTLAIGPYKSVRRYNHYYINGYNFHTYSYGKNKATMNYGVCVKSLQGSSYYGILQEVFELVYSGETRTYKTILFKCDWFDSGNGTKIHPQYKLVEVNHTKKYSKYDPFVLAFQVQQVYFRPYPSLKTDKDCWWAVFPVKVRSTIDIPKDQMAFQEEVIDDPPLLSNPNDGLDEVGVRDGFEEAVLLDENDTDIHIEVETDEVETDEDELLVDDDTSSEDAESDDFEDIFSD